jgi:antitoxin component of MazEF toxin-antitoxin module
MVAGRDSRNGTREVCGRAAGLIPAAAGCRRPDCGGAGGREAPEKRVTYNTCYNGFMKTKLRKIGSGYGVLLPKKVIDNLRLSVGDELELTEAEWGIELSPFDPDFADQVEAFRRTEGQHRNSYRELGKR